MQRLHHAAVMLTCLGAAMTAQADGSMNTIFMPKEVATPALADQVVIFPAKRVITMEKNQPEAAAVAIAGRRIVGVGSVAELTQQAGARRRTGDENPQ